MFDIGIMLYGFCFYKQTSDKVLILFSRSKKNLIFDHRNV